MATVTYFCLLDVMIIGQLLAQGTGSRQECLWAEVSGAVHSTGSDAVYMVNSTTSIDVPAKFSWNYNNSIATEQTYNMTSKSFSYTNSNPRVVSRVNRIHSSLFMLTVSVTSVTLKDNGKTLSVSRDFCTSQTKPGPKMLLTVKACNNSAFHLAEAVGNVIVGYGRNETFTCSQCTQVTANFTRTCGANGKWTDETNPCSFTCRADAITCGTPIDSHTLCGGLKHSFSCNETLICENTKFELECAINGSWVSPECNCSKGCKRGGDSAANPVVTTETLPGSFPWPIVGGIIGGVFGVGLISAVLYCIWRCLTHDNKNAAAVAFASSPHSEGQNPEHEERPNVIYDTTDLKSGSEVTMEVVDNVLYGTTGPAEVYTQVKLTKNGKAEKNAQKSGKNAQKESDDSGPTTSGIQAEATYAVLDKEQKKKKNKKPGKENPGFSGDVTEDATYSVVNKVNKKNTNGAGKTSDNPSTSGGNEESAYAEVDKKSKGEPQKDESDDEDLHGNNAK